VTMVGRDAPDSVRAQLAERLGATYVPVGENVLRPKDVERDGFDMILECTGSDTIMLAAAEALAPRGAMVWLGASRVPQSTTHNVAQLMRDAMLRNHIHIGCVNAASRDFTDALGHLGQLHSSDADSLSAVITDRIAPADSLRYYQERDRRSVKVVLMYE
jgi:threonine dehydrogenase-like Zn-dependent dehydrogenase